VQIPHRAIGDPPRLVSPSVAMRAFVTIEALVSHRPDTCLRGQENEAEPLVADGAAERLSAVCRHMRTAMMGDPPWTHVMHDHVGGRTIGLPGHKTCARTDRCRHREHGEQRGNSARERGRPPQVPLRMIMTASVPRLPKPPAI
jgi:hypothetical protein